MCPLYDWKDKKSQKAAVVLRAFKDYKEEPTNEEAEEAGLTPEEAKAAEWARVIGAGIQMLKGDGWGAGKGNW